MLINKFSTVILFCLLLSCSEENRPNLIENRTKKVILKKGVPQTIFGVEVEYQGMEVKFFAPPMETRSRTYFTFQTKYKGLEKKLSYSEGFPGDLSPKPRLKVGPVTFLYFDWQIYSDKEINMIFHIKNKAWEKVKNHSPF